MTVDVMLATKTRRKRYTHEFKLEVEAFYRNNNLYQTSMKFSLNTKTILRWVQKEELIDTSKKGSKHIVHHRTAMYPEMEAKLYDEYKQLRRQCLKVKSYWFNIRGKQLLTHMDPDSDNRSFQFSDGWFDAFKQQRHKIS